jgi:hypothetical protein
MMLFFVKETNKRGDIMKMIQSLCAAVLVSALAAAASNAAETSKRALKLDKPTPAMSADDLTKIDYVIKYTRFLEDSFIHDCTISYVPRSGTKRVRKAQRFRITLNRPEDDLDYKDMVVITHPENVKGLAVMTWSYMSPERQRDQWLWLPSLKKVRRSSPAEGEDAFLGSDFTTEDVTSRRWDDETYKKLPDEVFPGHKMHIDGKMVNEKVPCYVIECIPKKNGWYYSKRKVYLDKTTGANIFEEIYDPNGKLARTIVRVYEQYKEGPIQRILEAHTLATGHSTTINNDEYEVNSGIEEKIFTEKNLMRSNW